MSIRPYKQLHATSGGKRTSALSTSGVASWSPIKFETDVVNTGGCDGFVVCAYVMRATSSHDCSSADFWPLAAR
jgi:hypothetical protein|eukprot:COSAG02_NODE_6252_length_3699_cov_1.530556_1_plen_74_part_00